MISKSKLRIATGGLIALVLGFSAIKATKSFKSKAHRSLKVAETSVNLPNLKNVLPSELYEGNTGEYAFVIIDLPECRLGKDIIEYHNTLARKLEGSNVQVIYSRNHEVKDAFDLPGSPSYIIGAPDGEVLGRIPGIISSPDGLSHYEFLVHQLEEKVPGLDIRSVPPKVESKGLKKAPNIFL